MSSYTRSLYFLLTGAACFGVLSLNITIQLSDCVQFPIWLSGIGITFSIASILDLLYLFLAGVGTAKASWSTVFRELLLTLFLALSWSVYALATGSIVTSSASACKGGVAGICHEIEWLQWMAMIVSCTTTVYWCALVSLTSDGIRQWLDLMSSVRTPDFFRKTPRTFNNALPYPYAPYPYDNEIGTRFVYSVPARATMPIPAYLDMISSSYYHPDLVDDNRYGMMSAPVEPACPCMQERQFISEGGEEGFQVNQEAPYRACPYYAYA